MVRRAGQIPPRNPRPAPGVVVARLRRWMPGPVGEVLRRLQGCGGRPAVVGGAVRDAALGMRPRDWDVAVDLDLTAFRGVFPRVLDLGARFGTWTVLTPAGPVEVSRFRGVAGDLGDDLAHRDFTLNAMAVDVAAGVLVDPFGGLDDLAGRRLRAVGEASARLAEDPVRALRALRFVAGLGLRCDPALRGALAGATAALEGAAAERKRDELERLLSGRWLAPGLRLLEATGLRAVLLPELGPLRPRAMARARAVNGAFPWLRLAVLAWAQAVPPEALPALRQRLRLAKACGSELAGVVRALHALSPTPPTGASLRRWLHAAHPFETSAALAAEAAGGAAYVGFRRRVRRALGGCLQPAQLAIGGRELHRLGIAGPQVGIVLQRLLAAVLDVPQRNNRATLLRLVHTLSTGNPEGVRP